MRRTQVICLLWKMWHTWQNEKSIYVKDAFRRVCGLPTRYPLRNNRCHTGIFGIMLHMKDYATCTIGHVRCRKCCAQDNVQGGVVEVTIQQETTPPRSKAQQ